MSNSNEQSHLGTKLNYVIKFILLFPPQRVGYQLVYIINKPNNPCNVNIFSTPK
jgi:hypothetical protein